MIYETYGKELGDFEAGVLFNWKNRTSDINAQENLNAIQTSVVEFLRETSRDLDDDLGRVYDKHPLFKTNHNNKKKHFPTGEVIVEDDARMRMLFIMAHIFAWYNMYVDAKGKINMNGGKSWSWDDIMLLVNKESEAWDADDKYKGRRVKEMTELLDLLRKVLNAFNSHSKNIKADFQLLRFVVIFYYTMLDKYGKKNVTIDASKFAAFLNTVVSELNGKKKLAYRDYKGDNSDDTRDDIAWKVLRAFLKHSDTRGHRSLDIAFDGSATFKRAIEDVKFLQESGVRVTPKPASESVKEELYRKQGSLDAVDGRYCKLEDMDYAHTDIPSSAGVGKGAVTSSEENSLVWSFWNNRMGQSTIEEYRNSEDYARFSYKTDERLQEYGMR